MNEVNVRSASNALGREKFNFMTGVCLITLSHSLGRGGIIWATFGRRGMERTLGVYGNSLPDQTEARMDLQ